MRSRVIREFNRSETTSKAKSKGKAIPQAQVKALSAYLADVYSKLEEEGLTGTNPDDLDGKKDRSHLILLIKWRRATGIENERLWGLFADGIGDDDDEFRRAARALAAEVLHGGGVHRPGAAEDGELDTGSTALTVELAQKVRDHVGKRKPAPTTCISPLHKLHDLLVNYNDTLVRCPPLMPHD